MLHVNNTICLHLRIKSSTLFATESRNRQPAGPPRPPKTSPRPPQDAPTTLKDAPTPSFGPPSPCRFLVEIYMGPIKGGTKLFLKLPRPPCQDLPRLPRPPPNPPKTLPRHPNNPQRPQDLYNTPQIEPRDILILGEAKGNRNTSKPVS